MLQWHSYRFKTSSGVSATFGLFNYLTTFFTIDTIRTLNEALCLLAPPSFPTTTPLN
jgi:hypothetical protein